MVSLTRELLPRRAIGSAHTDLCYWRLRGSVALRGYVVLYGYVVLVPLLRGQYSSEGSA